MHAVERLHRQTRLVEQLVGLEHVANLLPGPLHELFLILPFDLRAESSGGSRAWIEIELSEPHRRIRRNGVLPDMPLAVQRRTEG